MQATPYLVPSLPVLVSLVAAIISYYNFSLNKTLNIKNQLFNEKLKKYIELSRKLAEFIELLDKAGPILNRAETDAKAAEELKIQAERFDKIGLEIEYLVIDAHMLVPEKVVTLLLDFVRTQNLGSGYLSSSNTKTFWKNDELIREKAEQLILAFRDDLHVDKLSFSLARPKILPNG